MNGGAGSRTIRPPRCGEASIVMTKIRSGSSGRIRDRRGSGGGGGSLGGMLGGGGGGLPIPMKAGGGLVGVIVLVVIVVITQFGGGGGADAPGLVGPDDGAAEEPDQGRSLVRPNSNRSCVAPSTTCPLYWEEQFPVSFQGAFPGTDTVFFSGSTQTGCGGASSQTGPFYCPADQLVYFDLDFLEQLQAEFGATGDLAAQYIVAHEYGHHVQNVTGISDRTNAAQQQNPDVANEFSVALELAGRLLRRCVGVVGGRAWTVRRDSEIEEALERGRGGRRRPDPGVGWAGGEPRVIHPRQRRTAPYLVRHRFRLRRSRAVHHLRQLARAVAGDLDRRHTRHSP